MLLFIGRSTIFFILVPSRILSYINNINHYRYRYILGIGRTLFLCRKLAFLSCIQGIKEWHPESTIYNISILPYNQPLSLEAQILFLLEVDYFLTIILSIFIWNYFAFALGIIYIQSILNQYIHWVSYKYYIINPCRPTLYQVSKEEFHQTFRWSSMNQSNHYALLLFSSTYSPYLLHHL